jgi:hypothetical protein
MGETVKSSHSVRDRLRRPLGFLLLAVHAENLGLPSNRSALASTQAAHPTARPERLEPPTTWFEATESAPELTDLPNVIA